MEERFWLIQRGKFQDASRTYDQLCGGGNGLISLDYMGSSEFEFGCIPAAYRRIMARFEEYRMYETSIKNRDKKNLILFCREDKYQITLDAWDKYLKELYPLKEYSGLPYYMGKDSIFLGNRSNFWWAVEGPRRSNIGDCMVFWNNETRKVMFNKYIKHDFENWWMQLDKKEREEQAAEAFDYQF